MLSVEFDRFGPPEVLEVRERPEPLPAEDRVRVQVRARTANVSDVELRRGDTPQRLKELGLAFPAVLGWDFVGILLDPTPTLPAGSAVAGFVPWLGSEVGRGTYAEVISIKPQWVAALPPDLDPARAAVFAMNALTGAQATDRMGPLEGANILIVGAGGPVGMSAATAAAAAGAHVYVTGSMADDALATHGYAGVISRGTPEEMAVAAREAVPGGMDAVFNAAVAGPGLIRAVKDGGTFVSIHVADKNEPERGIAVEKVVVQADPSRLTSLLTTALLDRIRIETLPLDQAREAHERLERGDLAGRKIVLVS
ncbi:zinc-binding dehydrogenase [Streptomyces sp. SID10853]|uniref:alcohol dehydrogenase catalytic domain-containing protein n=1 Tax=Streptomyces sp. SID10853 TaxID=2706028 RepID=UPI0013BFF3ED|nr:zinc-binding dehydrogenase [Streptomyces sp. SID10853]NDZ77290.1 zinc-binding dehydrogenase [Streptomyces sp. SID10853]